MSVYGVSWYDRLAMNSLVVCCFSSSHLKPQRMRLVFSEGFEPTTSDSLHVAATVLFLRSFEVVELAVNTISSN